MFRIVFTVPETFVFPNEVFDGYRRRKQWFVDDVNGGPVVMSGRSLKADPLSFYRAIVQDALETEPFSRGQTLHDFAVVNALRVNRFSSHVEIDKRSGGTRIGSDVIQFRGVHTYKKKTKKKTFFQKLMGDILFESVSDFAGRSD